MMGKTVVLDAKADVLFRLLAPIVKHEGQGTKSFNLDPLLLFVGEYGFVQGLAGKHPAGPHIPFAYFPLGESADLV
jgi:hypothetical protein